jgi:hypothetical protein
MKIIKQIDEVIQELDMSDMDRIEVAKHTRILENAKSTIENLDYEIREMQRR